jgi:hypothetical protein
MGEKRGSLGSADEPRAGPWALEAMSGETGFSAIAAGALSAARAPRARPPHPLAKDQGADRHEQRRHWLAKVPRPLL